MFEPPPNWHEGLPVESVRERLEREESQAWRDNPEVEGIGGLDSELGEITLRESR